jgi:beta-barrel assembly-enhancing protease
MERGRLIAGAILALVTLFGYFGYREYNPVTAEMQHVKISADQEIALGLRAAPELAAEYGGRSQDHQAAARVAAVGERLVGSTRARETPYRFAFHLLDDDRTINAFALPGGQVFITEALYRRLETEGELAGVLGHEIGHVVARHGAEHLAKAELVQGLGGAAVIASYDPDRPGSSYRNAAIAQAVGQLVNMRFGRDDELESDRLGLRFMAQAGYDPRAMLGVMRTLTQAAQGRGRTPEFFSTHPNPENRVGQIKREIQSLFPQGVPEGLRS